MQQPSNTYTSTVLKFTVNYFDNVQNIVILSRNLIKEEMTVSSLSARMGMFGGGKLLKVKKRVRPN